MTDDRMGQLQAAAQAVSALASAPSLEDRPPITVQAEDVRSMRTIAAALGDLAVRAAGYLAAEHLSSDGLVSTVKNPEAISNQLAGARLALTDASDRLFHVAGVLTVTDTVLSRLQPAPTDPEAHDDQP